MQALPTVLAAPKCERYSLVISRTAYCSSALTCSAQTSRALIVPQTPLACRPNTGFLLRKIARVPTP